MQSRVKRLAAIDIGTNSFHAAIVEIKADGSYVTLDTHKEMVKLGDDVAHHFISNETMERAVAAMKYIHVLCKNREVETILAYATSAIRESKNGGDFIQRVIDETGIKIQVIPGEREAELIGIAVQHAISIDEKEPVLVVDIGGGSVEFIICTQSKQLFKTSLKIGSSRCTSQFIHSDPISKSNLEELTKHLSQEIKPVLKAVEFHKPVALVGSSGTMESIAGLISFRINGSLPVNLNQFSYSKKDFDNFAKDFLKLNQSQRYALDGLEQKRADIILPGIVLTRLILEKTGLSLIKTSTFALREGMILDHIQSNKKQFTILDEFPDIRQRSIHLLLTKCNWHEKHSRQVARLALKLFDELKPFHQLNEHDRELLEYACHLHDIGYHISHKSHHLHAMYLIQNADLRGFDYNEICILAHVARYHRRSTPKKRHNEYMAFSKEIRKKIKQLSAFLRVADGLDRSHFQTVIDLQTVVTDNRIILQLQSKSDPQVEIWGALRKAELFEKLFHRELEIQFTIDSPDS